MPTFLNHSRASGPRAPGGAHPRRWAGFVQGLVNPTRPQYLELGHKAGGVEVMAGLIFSARVSARERKI